MKDSIVVTIIVVMITIFTVGFITSYYTGFDAGVKSVEEIYEDKLDSIIVNHLSK